MAKYAIGIDIGGTNTRAGIFSDKGKMMIGRTIKTKPKRNRNAIAGDILILVNYLKSWSRKRHLDLSGIGIGIPGAINGEGKLVFGGGTLERFTGLDLKKFFQNKFGLEVFVINDSQCFALAESYSGAGKFYNRVAGIIWATGIGAGFVDKKNSGISGDLYEIGHIVVDPNIKSGSKCGCGQWGCAVNLASGKNIERIYREKGGLIKNAGVWEIYRSKEKIAGEILEDAYKYLSLSISALINIFNPEIIIIGGGVSNLPEAAHAKIRKYIRRWALKSLTKNLKIKKSKLGNFAGALGAAMLIIKR